ncbi:C2H2 type zinc finger domain-containing protein [Colletotrichum sojae]|uniref:C2H2 type zinc finger domain-containing protein n=1 Tax=Colletotrichum sojae TaxID=2175907 RepID=A0A8H6JMU4_9PEZI|nr:C2H2 type zinc finger domain-containing protein [Colletotrichum sojae]
MTTIHEDMTMDEFVNWDAAAAEVGGIFNMPTQDVPPTTTADPNLDLVLENVDDDDFGFFALQHFDETGPVGAAPSGAALGPMGTLPASHGDIGSGKDNCTFDSNQCDELQDWWFAPEFPCVNCALGGYQCKKIREGRYKNYCTSCVALRSECSFATELPAAGDPMRSDALPSNPWPTMGDHPSAIPQEDVALPVAMPGTSTPDLLKSLASSSDEHAGLMPNPSAAPPAKIGARFSRESVRILKNWLSTHTRHPYPSDEEKEMLQRMTGLNKTQITNWLANARRRNKTQLPRSTSPHVRSSWTGPIDIPQRRGTPAPEARISTMNPLERWVDSPPENEPATVTAIARAVASSSGASSSGLNSPYSFNFTDDGSGRSLCNASSASSVGTSHSSGGSFASAYSHASRGSFGSFGSFNRGRRRRRRRADNKPENEKTSLATPLKTFQCTFCTETFRTKHDWQRHEKSLHLSLERWVCAPDGPVAHHPQTNKPCCVFCGEANPDSAHVESHNHSACQERTLEERTFYRKDHLNQHLRLVHNVKFVDWSMKAWKVATPEIRSRCGFCGVVMASWTARVEHLAEHFKTGNTMADWKGDWGFEAPVLSMVENSIPPYLIDNERNTPYPYKASGAPAETPRSAYELIKMELAYFMQNHHDKTGRMPSHEEMQLEACRIIFASEVLSLREISYPFSWLRDLIMSSETIMRQAKFGPMRSQIENRLSTLKINGKDNLFEACPLENGLHEFVRAKRLLGLTAMDEELQEEACKIVGKIEEVSTTPSDFIASWLVKLIYGSSSWLANFRQRAHLPRTEDIVNINERSTDSTKIDSTIHNYSRLERSLADYMQSQRALGIDPDDAELQRQARIIIYEFDDGWNQTAADNLEWLAAFKQRHQPTPASGSSLNTSPASQGWLAAGGIDLSLPGTSPSNVSSAAADSTICPIMSDAAVSSYLDSSRSGFVKTGPFFLNDANCYRRLARELGRWVAATTSPNNPNSHVPTDAEIQHQARWILYDDDDPWNQTAADNAEWLQRFKRDAGIATEPGPGLPEGDSWSLSQGGSGFAPPYVYTKGNMAPYGDKMTGVPIRDVKMFDTDSAVLNKYLETFKTRYAKPATIFCARELEDGLIRFVETEVAVANRFPDDDSLRAQARLILKQPSTAADDSVLLNKFKEWMRVRLGEQQQQQQQPQLPTSVPAGMDLTVSEADMNKFLQDMNFDFSAADLEGLELSMGMDMGGGAPLADGPAT